MRNKVVLLLACALILAAAVAFWWPRHAPPQSIQLPLSFSGPSSELKDTIVVPTLDTPLPPGKSAIWCAAFDLAWKQGEKDIFKGPCRTQNGQEIAARLTASPASPEDCAPESLCVMAGPESNVVPRIRAEMSRKFPGVEPSLHDVGMGCLAYAYLSANVPFQIPFFDNDQPLIFESASGQRVPVASFGLRRKDESCYMELRAQVHVLFANRPTDKDDPRLVGEFAVDPCRTSKPYQIVLALIKPQATLAADIERVKELAAAPPEEFDSRELGPNSALLIPNQNWEVTHPFKELLGPILNPGWEGLPLIEALEKLRFRLDRSGAELSAEAHAIYLCLSGDLIFDRPFLVYIQKRGGTRPFFAMWIANAELLQKK